MKIIVWIVFAVLAAAWTLGALIAVELVQWGSQFIASGAAADLGAAAAKWPAPAWLSIWLDPATIRAAQEGLVAGFEALRSALPWIGAAVGWLVPLAWLAWGLGVLVLLAGTAAAHWLVARGLRHLAGAR